MLAGTTRTLVDSLHIERVVCVGHSMGGMLAARFTLMFPDRVEKLVLVNPIGLEDWKTVVPHRSIDDQYQEELRATPETIRAYESKSYFAGQWKPEYDALIALQAGWTKHPEFARVAWCSALTADMIFTQPVVYELPLVRVPTLLIIGQRDRTAVGSAWAPKDVAAMRGALSQARAQGCGGDPGREAGRDPRRETLAAGRGVRDVLRRTARLRTLIVGLDHDAG